MDNSARPDAWACLQPILTGSDLVPAPEAIIFPLDISPFDVPLPGAAPLSFVWVKDAPPDQSQYIVLIPSGKMIEIDGAARQFCYPLSENTTIKIDTVVYQFCPYEFDHEWKLLPETNAKYQRRSFIAQGGQGSVFIADSRSSRTTVAIKTIIFSPKTRRRGRFELLVAREVSGLRRLQEESFHPHLFCRYIEHHVGPVQCDIVMEYAQGETLRAYLHRHPQSRISEVQAHDIIQYVCVAASEMHRVNMIHRDIKPDNILIMVDGAGRIRVKLLDLGLARSLLEDTPLTHNIGTGCHVDARVFLGESYDFRVDSYGVATTLYEMLMGTPAHYIPPVRYPDYHQAVLDRTEAWLRRFAAATTNQNLVHFVFCLAQTVEGHFTKLEEALSHPWLVHPENEIDPWHAELIKVVLATADDDSQVLEAHGLEDTLNNAEYPVVRAPPAVPDVVSHHSAVDQDHAQTHQLLLSPVEVNVIAVVAQLGISGLFPPPVDPLDTMSNHHLSTSTVSSWDGSQAANMETSSFDQSYDPSASVDFNNSADFDNSWRKEGWKVFADYDRGVASLNNSIMDEPISVDA